MKRIFRCFRCGRKVPVPAGDWTRIFWTVSGRAFAKETAGVLCHYVSMDFDALTAGLRRLSKGKRLKPESRETVRRSGAAA